MLRPDAFMRDDLIEFAMNPINWHRWPGPAAFPFENGSTVPADLAGGMFS